ncbi:MAG TPA: chorismate mutase [Candidatus Limadaptatus stercorigallinarum]|jgi:prephenate dehydratase|uniref:Bifunctional chorismate mutase/prephenate dehydratase n=1 Tax=Candidatus Limadaptatus stercorigallinarum TaxID=2840845 RepID=A0A9D1L140_9FIRM|nr:chorismate mutase [Candidatus Limadaptatus stercorigallinarum]
MIEELRKKIDELDDKIAELYLERQRTVREIGEEKARTHAAVLDPAREKKIIARVTKQADDEQKIYLKRVFETILETSRAYQRRLVAPVTPLSDNLRRVLMEGKKYFPVSSTVACQGVEGSYSSIAADKLFEIADITFFRNFEGVFQAVEKGLCDYGVLPIENSAVGSVNAVYDLMKKHRFYIVRSIKLKVCHHLLAKKGVALSDIREVYSHEQAIGQCSAYLQKLPSSVKITACPNTAVAAEMVANSDRNDVACISSRNCAELYGLGILESNIQDNDSNYTRFICISKTLEVFAPANRISIMMTLPHESGSLNRVLNKFSTLGLNLTKLESRPLPGTDFEFMFYFDFEGQIENSDTLSLIAELDQGTEQFTFLGSYYEVAQ